MKKLSVVSTSKRWEGVSLIQIGKRIQSKPWKR